MNIEQLTNEWLNKKTTDGQVPHIGTQIIERLSEKTYAERAGIIIGAFLQNEKLAEDLTRGLDDYASTMKISDNSYVIETFDEDVLSYKGGAFGVACGIVGAMMHKSNISRVVLVGALSAKDVAMVKVNEGGGVCVLAFCPTFEGDGAAQIAAANGDGKIKPVFVQDDVAKIQSEIERVLAKEQTVRALAEHGAQVIVFDERHPLFVVPLLTVFYSAYADLVEAEEIENGQTLSIILPCERKDLVLAAMLAKKTGLPLEIIRACKKEEPRVMGVRDVIVSEEEIVESAQWYLEEGIVVSAGTACALAVHDIVVGEDDVSVAVISAESPYLDAKGTLLAMGEKPLSKYSACADKIMNLSALPLSDRAMNALDGDAPAVYGDTQATIEDALMRAIKAVD